MMKQNEIQSALDKIKLILRNGSLDLSVQKGWEFPGCVEVKNNGKQGICAQYISMDSDTSMSSHVV